MKKKKRNKYFWPLLAAVFLIWGTIVHKSVTYYLGSEEEIIEEYQIETSDISKAFEKQSNEKTTSLEYEKLDRNPFSFAQTKEKSSVKKKKQDQTVAAQTTAPKIDFALKGVVVKANSKMIILEDRTNNKTLFLHEGDTYEFIKIKTITASKITYWNSGKLKEYAIK